MTDPFYRTVDLDGWSLTISSSDTVDLVLDGGPMPFSFCLNADQAEELLVALQAALEKIL
jgi:hypothetical protein